MEPCRSLALLALVVLLPELAADTYFFSWQSDGVKYTCNGLAGTSWANYGPSCILFLDSKTPRAQAPQQCASYSFSTLLSEQSWMQLRTLPENGGQFWISIKSTSNETLSDGFDSFPIYTPSWADSQPMRIGSDQCIAIDLGYLPSVDRGWKFINCSEQLKTACETFACMNDEFRCSDNSRCIPCKSVKDGIEDCLDGSDERNTATCGNIQNASSTRHTDGRWKRSLLESNDASADYTCPLPTQLDQVEVLSVSGFAVGQTIHWKCNAGFEPRKASSICNSNKQWQPIVQCKASQCTTPPPIVLPLNFPLLNYTGRNHGDRAFYSQPHATDWDPELAFIFICDNGEWINFVDVLCYAYSFPFGHFLDVTVRNREVMDYQCVDGFVKGGPDPTCENGTLSAPPSCVTGNATSCGPNGVLKQSPYMLKFCECSDGYTIDANNGGCIAEKGCEANNVICTNGGKCEDYSGGGYGCVCPSDKCLFGIGTYCNSSYYADPKQYNGQVQVCAEKRCFSGDLPSNCFPASPSAVVSSLSNYMSNIDVYCKLPGNVDIQNAATCSAGQWTNVPNYQCNTIGSLKFDTPGPYNPFDIATVHWQENLLPTPFPTMSPDIASTIMCGPNGQWIGDPPSGGKGMLGVCNNSGYYVADLDSVTNSARCKCMNDADDQRDCSTFCLHGGTPYPTNPYQCNCKEPYVGDRCDQVKCSATGESAPTFGNSIYFRMIFEVSQLGKDQMDRVLSALPSAVRDMHAQNPFWISRYDMVVLSQDVSYVPAFDTTNLEDAMATARNVMNSSQWVTNCSAPQACMGVSDAPPRGSIIVQFMATLPGCNFYTEDMEQKIRSGQYTYILVELDEGMQDCSIDPSAGFNLEGMRRIAIESNGMHLRVSLSNTADFVRTFPLLYQRQVVQPGYGVAATSPDIWKQDSDIYSVTTHSNDKQYVPSKYEVPVMEDVQTGNFVYTEYFTGCNSGAQSYNEYCLISDVQPRSKAESDALCKSYGAFSLVDLTERDHSNIIELLDSVAPVWLGLSYYKSKWHFDLGGMSAEPTPSNLHWNPPSILSDPNKTCAYVMTQPNGTFWVPTSCDDKYATMCFQLRVTSTRKHQTTKAQNREASNGAAVFVQKSQTLDVAFASSMTSATPQPYIIENGRSVVMVGVYPNYYNGDWRMTVTSINNDGSRQRTYYPLTKRDVKCGWTFVSPPVICLPDSTLLIAINQEWSSDDNVYYVSTCVEAGTITTSTTNRPSTTFSTSNTMPTSTIYPPTVNERRQPRRTQLLTVDDQLNITYSDLSLPWTIDAGGCYHLGCVPENTEYCYVGGDRKLHCSCKDGIIGDKCHLTYNPTPSSCKYGVAVDQLSKNLEATLRGGCSCSSDGMNCPLNTAGVDMCGGRCGAHGQCTFNTSTKLYYCKCDSSSYMGEFCEVQLTSCMTTHCKNGGTCQADGTCKCRLGYAGALCESYMLLCSNSTCMNGGTCTELEPGRIFCQCSEGWTGYACDESLELALPCFNNAQRNPNDSCSCIPPWKGGRCTVLEDKIPSSMCNCTSDMDQCVMDDEKSTCLCRSGWAGDHCQSPISYCRWSPCTSNGVCTEDSSGYNCKCSKGYNGSMCEDWQGCHTDGDCQHGGTCELSTGICKCTAAYNGTFCEDYRNDPCVTFSCQNGGRCETIQREPTCLCDIHYVGEKCEKKRLSSMNIVMDLHQSGISLPLPDQKNGFSLCAWIRHMDATVSGHQSPQPMPIVSITSNGKENLRVTTQLVTVQGALISQIMLRPFFWQQFCVQRTSDGQFRVFVNAEMKNSTKVSGSDILNAHISIVPKSISGESPYVGTISHLELYNYILSAEEMGQMTFNCSRWAENVVPSKIVIPWANITSQFPRSQLSVPGFCERSVCFPGSSTCIGGQDKSPPVASVCPATVFIIIPNGKRTVSAIWDEPVFLDDFEIASVTSNYRSGQLLIAGDYHVVYSAVDTSGNVGRCEFDVFVSLNPCQMPNKSANGVIAPHSPMAFGANSSISVQCNDPKFPLRGPKFYTCDYFGQWMRSALVPSFMLPACANTTVPDQTITGSVGFAKGTTEQCEKDRKKIEEIIKFVLSLICNDDCGNEKVIVTSCDGTENVVRPRKILKDDGNKLMFDFAVNDDADKLVLEFTVDLSSSQDNIADQLTDQLKNISDDVTAKPEISCNSSYPVQAHHDGSFLCAQTAVGTFYNTSTRQAQTCSKGSYQDKVSQTSPNFCEPGYTTAGDGATSAKDCYKDCPVGQYCRVESPNADKDSCKLCPHGQYNDQTGQTSCLPCPIGLSTDDEGSPKKDDCKNTCKLGEQLGADEICAKCNKGDYKEDIHQLSCTTCPPGLTTVGYGSQHKSDCSVLYCPADHYISPNATRTGINPDDFKLLTSCPECQQGYMQPEPNQDSCVVCKPNTDLALHSTCAITNDCMNNSDCSKNMECIKNNVGKKYCAPSNNKTEAPVMAWWAIVLIVVGILAILAFVGAFMYAMRGKIGQFFKKDEKEEDEDPTATGPLSPVVVVADVDRPIEDRKDKDEGGEAAAVFATMALPRLMTNVRATHSAPHSAPANANAFGTTSTRAVMGSIAESDDQRAPKRRAELLQRRAPPTTQEVGLNFPSRNVSPEGSIRTTYSHRHGLPEDRWGVLPVKRRTSSKASIQPTSMFPNIMTHTYTYDVPSVPPSTISGSRRSSLSESAAFPIRDYDLPSTPESSPSNSALSSRNGTPMNSLRRRLESLPMTVATRRDSPITSNSSSNTTVANSSTEGNSNERRNQRRNSKLQSNPIVRDVSWKQERPSRLSAVERKRSEREVMSDDDRGKLSPLSVKTGRESDWSVLSASSYAPPADWKSTTLATSRRNGRGTQSMPTTPMPIGFDVSLAEGLSSDEE